ncbi:MAG: FeoB-associated Cys-rich membrane protein [Oscillospiraceae bacterium]|nr:FeoB-associated Cys-rich membrane protein [Oscillospiraceae bacterium]
MGTYLVAGILAVIVGLILRYLGKQWKTSHGFCGGECKSCGHCSGLQNSGGCTGSCAGCSGCAHRQE